MKIRKISALLGLIVGALVLFSFTANDVMNVLPPNPDECTIVVDYPGTNSSPAGIDRDGRLKFLRPGGDTSGPCQCPPGAQNGNGDGSGYVGLNAFGAQSTLNYSVFYLGNEVASGSLTTSTSTSTSTYY